MAILVIVIDVQAAVTVVVNGSNHTIPQTNERGWGSAVTAWIQAITSFTLQPTGGTFTLTADVDFGSSFGLKAPYLTSKTANPSTSGVLRLARTDTVSFRNAANSANLPLGVDGSNNLTFNSIALPTTASASFTDSGLFITDDGDATKKIALQASGIATSTTRTITMPDANVNLGALTNSNIDTSAAIAYSKLNLGTSIVNADVNAAAAIAYSKLNLSSSIVNADVAGAAAIARSKIATGSNYRVVTNGVAGALEDAAAITASRVLVSDVNGIPTHAATTTTTLGYLDATSSVQTQLDARVSKSTYTAKGSILAATAASTPANLVVGADGLFLKADSSASAGVAWASAASGALGVAAKTTTYTATTSDDVLTASGSAFTITLYTAVGNTGKILRFVKTDSSLTNIITIDANSSETINGALTTTLNTQYEQLTLVSDGTNWLVLDRRVSSSVVDAGAMTITGATTNPTKGTTSRDKVYWRREGQYAFISYQYLQTVAGAAGSGEYIFALPTGMTIDTTIQQLFTPSLANANGSTVPTSQMGVGWFGNGTARGPVTAFARTSTTFSLVPQLDFSTMSVMGSANQALSTATIAFGITIRVPISGWND